MSQTTARRMGHLGFSLLELLIVIAIIVLLLALFLPVVSSVRESSRQAACASNLRQLTAALLMYAQVNRGQTPSPARLDMILPDDWVFWEEPPYGTRGLGNSALAPYLGLRNAAPAAVLRCPSDPLLHDTKRPGGYPFSFSMSTGLWRVTIWEQIPRLPITKVKHPSDKSLFYDEDDHINDGAFWYAFPDDNLTARHRGRGNIGFFDGHVEAEFPSFAHDRKHNDPRY